MFILSGTSLTAVEHEVEAIMQTFTVSAPPG